MAIDSSPFIAGWDTTVPKVGDPRGEGANQIKAVKTAVKNSFPNVGGPVEADHERMNQVFASSLPQVGMIMMFSGNESEVALPWAVCDGTVKNNIVTPDLRGRFIMGATDTEVSGSTGGSNVFDGKKTEGHALSLSEIPSHDHNYTDSFNGNSQGGQSGGFDGGDQTKPTKSLKTGAVGGNQAHSHNLKGDSRPAYYTLAYIMYVGFPST